MPIGRSPFLAWFYLALANGVPIVLALSGRPWPLAPLIYCGGNALAILEGTRATFPDEESQSGLVHTWLPCLVVTIAALSWMWLSEPVGLVNDGLAWDGRHYAALYSYFSSGTYLPIRPEFPYTQRVGLPFLAAQLPFSARSAFLTMHGIFWSATMVLFSLCCRTAFRLKPATIRFGVLWLQLLWLSIPRSVAGYPFTVDSAALFFIQCWIFLLLTKRGRLLLPLVAFVGVFFKETVFLIALLSSVVLLGMRISSASIVAFVMCHPRKHTGYCEDRTECP